MNIIPEHVGFKLIATGSVIFHDANILIAGETF